MKAIALALVLLLQACSAEYAITSRFVNGRNGLRLKIRVPNPPATASPEVEYGN